MDHGNYTTSLVNTRILESNRAVVGYGNHLIDTPNLPNFNEGRVSSEKRGLEIFNSFAQESGAFNAVTNLCRERYIVKENGCV